MAKYKFFCLLHEQIIIIVMEMLGEFYEILKLYSIIIKINIHTPGRIILTAYSIFYLITLPRHIFVQNL